jgi:hypothetical protein
MLAFAQTQPQLEKIGFTPREPPTPRTARDSPRNDACSQVSLGKVSNFRLFIYAWKYAPRPRRCALTMIVGHILHRANQGALIITVRLFTVI